MHLVLSSRVFLVSYLCFPLGISPGAYAELKLSNNRVRKIKLFGEFFSAPRTSRDLGNFDAGKNTGSK
jgi:hypothetical protein